MLPVLRKFTVCLIFAHVHVYAFFLSIFNREFIVIDKMQLCTVITFGAITVFVVFVVYILILNFKYSAIVFFSLFFGYCTVNIMSFLLLSIVIGLQHQQQQEQLCFYFIILRHDEEDSI